MTDEQIAAVDESHRQFVIHLIVTNRQQMFDRRISYASRHHAREFLQSDLCIVFVRLLGLGGDMTDAEIARRLVDGQRIKG